MTRMFKRGFVVLAILLSVPFALDAYVGIDKLMASLPSEPVPFPTTGTIAVKKNGIEIGVVKYTMTQKLIAGGSNYFVSITYYNDTDEFVNVSILNKCDIKSCTLYPASIGSVEGMSPDYIERLSAIVMIK